MLGQGTSLIKGSPVCADSRAALRIAQRLGAEVRESRDSIEIDGSPLFRKERKVRAEGRRTADGLLEISCGESGLCMRMFSPIVALLDDTVRLVGEGSLVHRPMHMVETSLGLFGVHCISNKGKPPLTIRGPLGPRQTTVDAQGSSQFITGLLIALPLLAGDSEIKVENLVSSGYLDLTREMCARFGVHIEKDNSGATFFIKGGQSYKASEVHIEGDWSGGAFLAVAAAMAGEAQGVRIQGLSQDSRQPDRAIVEALAAAGRAFALKAQTSSYSREAFSLLVSTRATARTSFRLLWRLRPRFEGFLAFEACTGFLPRRATGHPPCRRHSTLSAPRSMSRATRCL